MGFPKSICISTNDILVHGVPNKEKFKQGDWVNLDVTVYNDGFYGDNSTMVTFGEVDKEIKHLIEITKTCLYEAIDKCKVGKPLQIIGETIK